MTLGFHGFFCKTTIISQLMNRKSKKYEKIQTKTVGISCECLRVVVSALSKRM